MKKVLVMLGCVLLIVTGLAAQNETVEVIGGDDAALREFITHLLPDTDGEQVVLIGALPDEMPFDVPLPADARIVGSVLQSDPFDLEIILESRDRVEDVAAFYATELAEAGWIDTSLSQYDIGFVPQQTQFQFCDASDNFISLLTRPQADATTDIWLQIQAPMRANQCSVMAAPPVTSVIPRLEAPEGVLKIEGGGSTSTQEGMESVSALLTTELSADELLQHYSQLMENAGWTLIDQQASDDAAWNSWTITGSNDVHWNGLLLIEDSAVSDNQQQAIITVELVQ